MDVPVLYITAELESAEVHIPSGVAPPAVLLTGMCEGNTPVQGYLLTPAMYWRTLSLIERMESRWWDGQVLAGVMAEAWGKWAKIDSWAQRHIGEAALRAECPPFGSKLPPLPRPPHWRDGKCPFDAPGDCGGDAPVSDGTPPPAAPDSESAATAAAVAPQPEKIQAESMTKRRPKPTQPKRPARREEPPGLFG